MKGTKLEAHWKKLIMVNYKIDAALLTQVLPYKTELDLFNHTAYISLVGFMFLDSRFGSVPIPFHQSFEEVNLRFYVRYAHQDTWRRGVVFINEIVPKPAVTFVANAFYKEHYMTLPMKHTWNISPDSQQIAYHWKKDAWNSISIVSSCIPEELVPGSAEEFFTEHYWGYTKINDLLTLEYNVDHPRWQVYKTMEHSLTVDFESVYGSPFGFLSAAIPESVFLAEGSAIVLQKGDRIGQD